MPKIISFTIENLFCIIVYPKTIKIIAKVAYLLIFILKTIVYPKTIKIIEKVAYLLFFYSKNYGDHHKTWLQQLIY